MRVIEIKDIVPWCVLGELGFKHWDEIRTVVIGCLDEQKEEDFNRHIESVFAGKGDISEADVRNYILHNIPAIAKALELKERC